MCGGHGSFRLCGDQPRGSALLGDRLPSFERFLSCLAHPREVIRAGRQKPDVVAVPLFKKGHISSSTVSTEMFSKGTAALTQVGMETKALGCERLNSLVPQSQLRREELE